MIKEQDKRCWREDVLNDVSRMGKIGICQLGEPSIMIFDGPCCVVAGSTLMLPRGTYMSARQTAKAHHQPAYLLD